jgi:hypothetical protein
MDKGKPGSRFQEVGGGAAIRAPCADPAVAMGVRTGQVTLLQRMALPLADYIGAGCKIPHLRLAAKNNPESARGRSCQLAEARG